MSENVTRVAFDAEIEEEELSGGEKIFVASCRQVDIASQGATVEEATHNLTAALELWLQTASPTEVQDRIPSLRSNSSHIYNTRIEVPYGQTASSVGR